ncbi:HEPACAM family member 2 [Acipenser ruthenus]|uniref:HEPACAM family member 2 n=1 Tax=Acipenser ruthenus TaxID=7906 RepID=A0A444UE14_ACIRT|nr:HEPACAM family member 2 [Acipenser ruthenus]
MAVKALGPSRNVFLFCCLNYISFTAVCGTLRVTTNQSLVVGFENQSVLLPAVYILSEQPLFMQINWDFGMTPVILQTIHFQGGKAFEDPKKSFVSEKQYQGRVAVFPQNGSLLIKNLTLSDSGTYKITVKNSQTGSPQSMHVVLKVLQNEEASSTYLGLEGDEVNSTEAPPCQSHRVVRSGVGVAVAMEAVSFGVSITLLLLIYLIAKKTCLTRRNGLCKVTF